MQDITHLSNSYVQRDFMFSQLELTGQCAKVPEAFLQLLMLNFR